MMARRPYFLLAHVGLVNGYLHLSLQHPTCRGLFRTRGFCRTSLEFLAYRSNRDTLSYSIACPYPGGYLSLSDDDNKYGPGAPVENVMWADRNDGIDRFKKTSTGTPLAQI